MKSTLFSQLKGQRIVSIDAAEGGDKCIIVTNAEQFRLYHCQDCCESVSINKVIGTPTNLVGKTVTLAEADSKEPDKFTHEFGPYDGSHTWSAFYIEADGVRVEIWFLGESNGHYSESVSLEVTDRI